MLVGWRGVSGDDVNSRTRIKLGRCRFLGLVQAAASAVRGNAWASPYRECYTGLSSLSPV